MSALFSALAEYARPANRRIALSDENFSIGYADLLAAVDDLADRIAAACPGNAPVAVMADNSAAWVLIDLALARGKRIALPVPGFFTPQQRTHALAETGAGWFITEDAEGTIGIAGRSFAARALATPTVNLPPDTAKITFTSGTTGAAKGVCLSQTGLEDVAASIVEAVGVESAGKHVPLLPLAVLLENVAGLYPTLFAGGHYRALSGPALGLGSTFFPDFAKMLGALREEQATSVILVPELLRGLLGVMAATGERLPSMKLVAVGGARVAPALLDQAEAMGLPVFEGYGLSEAGSVVAMNTPAARRRGSVGKLLNHVNFSLAADGELILNPPHFLGYVGGGEPPGAYATGDIGRIDEDGFIHLDGRKSNVLITAFARNVSPEWVESELIASPFVAQACVFGDGAPSLGALVVAASGTVTDAQIDAAVDAANAALPEYARVRHWAKVLPFLPGNGQLTSNGRLRRREIHAAHGALMQACLVRPGRHTSFFDRLVAETAHEQAYLAASPQIQDGLEGRISLKTYLHYLAEAFHHVRHTVPLLERVRDLLPPSKQWLREAARTYIEEETGHEEWILNDIRNAGGDAERVRHSEPRLSTELMVAFAYDFVTRINPVGFFGMVFVLEGTSTQLATRGADAVMKSLGLGPECFSYLTSHGAIDLSHIRFLQDLLNRLDDPADQAAVIHMAKRMFILFADVFRSIPHVSGIRHAA